MGGITVHFHVKLLWIGYFAFAWWIFVSVNLLFPWMAWQKVRQVALDRAVTLAKNKWPHQTEQLTISRRSANEWKINNMQGKGVSRDENIWRSGVNFYLSSRSTYIAKAISLLMVDLKSTSISTFFWPRKALIIGIVCRSIWLANKITLLIKKSDREFHANWTAPQVVLFLHFFSFSLQLIWFFTRFQYSTDIQPSKNGFPRGKTVSCSKAHYRCFLLHLSRMWFDEISSWRQKSYRRSLNYLPNRPPPINHLLWCQIINQ